MNYNPRTGCIQVSPEEAKRAYFSLLHAIKCIRQLTGSPLAPYERIAPLNLEDHAMKSIIDGARDLGIDMGGEWGEQLDVRNCG